MEKRTKEIASLVQPVIEVGNAFLVSYGVGKVVRKGYDLIKTK